MGVTVRADRPDQCRLAAWGAFLDSHRRLTRTLEAEMERDHALSLPEYEVLLRLSRSPTGQLRLHELVTYARMTKSGVTRLVERMQKGGLIETRRCESDRRGAFAVLTSRGRAVLRRAAVTHLAGVQEHFGRHLDDAEAAALRATLEQLGRVAGARPAAQPAAARGRRAVSGAAIAAPHAGQ